jgi:hypothetical protein
VKRIVMMFLIGTGLAASAIVTAEPAPDANAALLAAPAGLRDGATIIRWNPDYTHDTVHQGTNKLVCFDVSGMFGQPAVSIECTNMANLDRVAQNLKFQAEPDKGKRQAAIDAAEANGTRAKPEYGSVWYHLRGPDREHAHLHTTIAVPGATSASTGLPDNGKQGTVWVMDAGTMTAHLMLPGQ